MMANQDDDKKHRISRWPWSLAAAALLIAGFAFPPEGIPGVAFCWLYALTGLPCPACGLTRSFSAIAHGRFSYAWRMNPLGYVAFTIACALVLAPALRRIAPQTAQRLAERRWVRATGWALLAAFIAFGLLRLYARWHPELARFLHIETWPPA